MPCIYDAPRVTLEAYLDAKNPMSVTSAKILRCHETAVYQAWQTRQERITAWDGHRLTAEDYAILWARPWLNATRKTVPVVLRYLDNLNT